MHTASSASCTARDSRSASLYATTDAMPIFRHARWMRRAISPRFAIRILLNTVYATPAGVSASTRAIGWPYSTAWPDWTSNNLTDPSMGLTTS